MKDYNFFEEYVFKSNKGFINKLIIPSIFVVFIGTIIGIYLINLSTLKELNTTHEENVLFINSSEYIDKMAELENTIAYLALLEKMQSDTYVFKSFISNNYVVTEDITEMIVNSIPRNVVFKSYEITSSGVNIEGLATNYSYVAELEKNFRSLNEFSNIFVSTIDSEAESDDDDTGSSGLVSFTIDLTIGGESDD